MPIHFQILLIILVFYYEIIPMGRCRNNRKNRCPGSLLWLVFVINCVFIKADVDNCIKRLEIALHSDESIFASQYSSDIVPYYLQNELTFNPSNSILPIIYDIGDYEHCNNDWNGWQHCLVGPFHEGLISRPIAPLGGICVPKDCKSNDLATIELQSFVDSKISWLSSLSSTDAGSVAKLTYFQSLKASIDYVLYSSNLFTCGSHQYGPISYLSFTFLVLGVLAALLILVLIMSVLDMAEISSFEYPSSSKLVEFFHFFSVFHVLELSFRRSTQELFFLDGIRALSTLWVMVGHTLALWTSVGLLNPEVVLPPTGMLAQPIGQLFLSSRFAVDTFFFLSGFLVLSRHRDMFLMSDSNKQSPNPSDDPPNYRMDKFNGTINSSSRSSVSEPCYPLKTSNTASTSPTATTPGPTPSPGTTATSSNSSTSTTSMATRKNPMNKQTIFNHHENNNESNNNHVNDLNLSHNQYYYHPPQAEKSNKMFVYRVCLFKYLQYCLHRWVRLMPIYLLCFLLWWIVIPVMAQGPYAYLVQHYSQQCQTEGWTNLLLINNLLPYQRSETDQCFYVSWYVAADWQLSVLLAPIVFAIFSFGGQFSGRLFLMGLIVSSMIIAGGGWSAHSFDGINVTHYAESFYTKPQFRLPCYCLGMLAAEYLGIRKESMSMSMSMSMSSHGSNQRKTTPAESVGCQMGLLGIPLVLIGVVIIVLGCIFLSISAYQRRPCNFQETTSPFCGSNWSSWALSAYVVGMKPLWAMGLMGLMWLCYQGTPSAASKWAQASYWPQWRSPSKSSLMSISTTTTSTAATTAATATATSISTSSAPTLHYYQSVGRLNPTANSSSHHPGWMDEDGSAIPFHPLPSRLSPGKSLILSLPRFLASFLSSSCWVIGSKLSYPIYLTHVSILNLWIASLTQKIVFSWIGFWQVFVSVLLASWTVSVLLLAMATPLILVGQQLEHWLASWDPCQASQANTAKEEDSRFSYHRSYQNDYHENHDYNHDDIHAHAKAYPNNHESRARDVNDLPSSHQINDNDRYTVWDFPTSKATSNVNTSFLAPLQSLWDWTSQWWTPKSTTTHSQTRMDSRRSSSYSSLLSPSTVSSFPQPSSFAFSSCSSLSSMTTTAARPSSSLAYLSFATPSVRPVGSFQENEMIEMVDIIS